MTRNGTGLEDAAEEFLKGVQVVLDDE